MFLLFFLLVEYHCLAVLLCSVSTTEAGNLSSVIKYAVLEIRSFCKTQEETTLKCQRNGGVQTDSGVRKISEM